MSGGGASPLLQELQALIAAEGPIGVDRFMALALGHPRHGYYMTRDPIGAEGDFVTAPEISQMFGELIGVWCAQVFQDLGRPPLLRLVELGPGRGTLMADLLRATRRMEGFHGSLAVHLVETSPVLRDRQRKRLVGHEVQIAWADALDGVPDDAPLLVVANEFFDALPIRQYERRDGRWHERRVGLDAAGALVMGLAPAPEVTLTREAPDGSIVEISGDSARIVLALGSRIRRWGGAALILDYGHDGGLGDTLQAVRRHGFVDPLRDPGEADLTAHVNFRLLAETARSLGLAVQGPIDQGRFLADMGIDVRTQSLLASVRGEAARAALLAARDRLLDPAITGMGRLFRVLALRHPALVPTPGFSEGEKPAEAMDGRSGAAPRLRA